MNINNLKSLSFYDLIKKDVSEATRYRFRDEIKRRLEDKDLVNHLKAWDAGPTNRVDIEEIDENEVPSPHPQGSLARRILQSGFDFSSMKKPENAKGLTQSVHDNNWSEDMMSGPQMRFWRSVKAHYRNWGGR